jgi:UDP-N-acetylglucosamine 2-epimerase
VPEEVNRVLTDHISTWLFCPTQTAVENLKREGIEKSIYQVGDIMYDSVLYYKTIACQQSNILKQLELSYRNYYVATIHRAENTDDPNQLSCILETFQQLDHLVIFPLHPRTRKRINQYNLNSKLLSTNIKVIDPLNYFDMLCLASQAKLILTDSGGVQKEAYMLRVPCITLREETEWVETTYEGWNHVTGVNTRDLLNKVSRIKIPNNYPYLFGDGKTAEKIYNILLSAN